MRTAIAINERTRSTRLPGLNLPLLDQLLEPGRREDDHVDRLAAIQPVGDGVWRRAHRCAETADHLIFVSRSNCGASCLYASVNPPEVTTAYFLRGRGGRDQQRNDGNEPRLTTSKGVRLFVHSLCISCCACIRCRSAATRRGGPSSEIRYPSGYVRLRVSVKKYGGRLGGSHRTARPRNRNAVRSSDRVSGSGFGKPNAAIIASSSIA